MERGKERMREEKVRDDGASIQAQKLCAAHTEECSTRESMRKKRVQRVRERRAT